MNQEPRIRITEDAPAISIVGESSSSQGLAYASITERFVALAIDYGIIFLPFQLIAWLLNKGFGRALELEHWIYLLVGINVLFILYETIFSSGGRVTLGKNLVGIAVVKKDQKGPLTWPQALLRALGYYISVGLFFGGFVLALVDDRKRALHDFLGGSVVVQLRERDTWEVWAVRALGLLLLIAFCAGMYRSFGGRNWQEQYKVHQAQNFLENLALLEEGHYLRYGYYTNNLERLALLSGDPVQFQRDMHKVFSTGRKGIRIGVQENTYKISALAKDKHKTPVYLTNKR